MRKRVNITGRSARAAAAAAAMLLIALTSALAASAGASGTGPVRIGAAARPPRDAVDLGPVRPDAPLSAVAVLRPRDPAGLEALARAVTTPGSPRYGQYLARGEFARRFGPSASSVRSVESALAGAGLSVEGAGTGGSFVHFSGPAARVAHALAVGIHSFRLRSGRIVHALTDAPALPHTAASQVAAIVGLGDAPRSHPLAVRAPRGRRPLPGAAAPAFPHPEGSPQPCPAASADAKRNGGLTDDRIAHAYGAFGLYGAGDTGAGVHVGIYEQEAFIRSDIRTFDTCYFGSAAAGQMLQRLHTIPVEGGAPAGPGEGESALDIEDVSAMAPGAAIDVYEAPETSLGELSLVAAMVGEDRDQLLSSSWGAPCEQEAERAEPGFQQAWSYLLQQAAAQGQTFLNASGDTGSDACEEAHREVKVSKEQNPVSTTELASEPWVLAVGGTTITDAGSTPAQEHVWNDGGEGGGGGGGISRSWAMPTWQRFAALPGIALPGGADWHAAEGVERRFGYPTGFCDETLPAAEAGTPCRLVPDVAAQADELTGAPTFYSQAFKGPEAPDGWITIGGTSSATPIWAAMLALAYASPTCRANAATAAGAGFANPLLYAVASDSAAYAASFNDITEGSNDIYKLAGGHVFPARRGFDLATGLGSPRLTGPGGAPGLAYYLCTYAAAGGSGAAPAVTGLSPAEGPVAGGEHVLVSGSGFQSGGISDVAALQVGTWHASIPDIRVLSPGLLEVVLPPARDTLPAGAPPPQDGAAPVQLLVTLTDGRTSQPGAASRFVYVDRSGGTRVPSITRMAPFGGSESAPASLTIFGSGFSGATGVSFGGIPAGSFQVLSDSQISVTPPSFSPLTACSPLPHGGIFAGESPANDVCQVEVVVQGPGGASRSATIRPPLEGETLSEQDGAPLPPPGCPCEVQPAVTEYDYAPAPAIGSVETTKQGSGEAAEALITAHGRGLGRSTLVNVFLGPADRERSIARNIVYETGTELRLLTPLPSGGPRRLPLSVRTLAGLSAPVSVVLP